MTDSVLIVIETAPPLPYWIEAGRTLSARGLRVGVVAIADRGPLLDELEAAGCWTAALGAPTAARYPAAALRLARLLRRDKPQLVHAVGPIPTAVAGVAAAGSDIPVLYHRHHVVPEERPLFPGVARRLADSVMAVSFAAAAAAAAEGTADARLCTAWNGVPKSAPLAAGAAEDVRSSLGIPCDAAVVAIVARLRPVKGHDVLLAALALMAPNFPRPLHLLVVGDGHHRAAVAEAARGAAEFGFFAHLVGHHDDIRPWLAAADVVAVPSLEESFGLGAVEAMAQGRPVVASDVGGLREVAPNGEALLVPAGDPVPLANALREVLLHDTVAVELARRGLARYEQQFTTEAMVARWLDCYSVARRAGRRRP